jgi:uncharacterized protein (DUF952 family)
MRIPSMLIFKITPAEEWKAAEMAGVYHGSAHDKADGFLHFSTASQLQETLRLYYANAGAIVIAAVSVSALGGALKYEYSESRKENFPHLYGSLQMTAVLSTLFTHRTTNLPLETDGLDRWLTYLETGTLNLPP